MQNGCFIVENRELEFEIFHGREVTRRVIVGLLIVMVMVMNLYTAFFTYYFHIIYIFKCDLWARSDLSTYRAS